MKFCFKFLFIAALFKSALFINVDKFYYVNSSITNDKNYGEASENSTTTEIEENKKLSTSTEQENLSLYNAYNIIESITETTTEIYSTTTENLAEINNNTETNTERTLFDSSTKSNIAEIAKENENAKSKVSTEHTTPQSKSFTTPESITTSEYILTSPTKPSHHFYKKIEIKKDNDIPITAYTQISSVSGSTSTSESFYELTDVPTLDPNETTESSTESSSTPESTTEPITDEPHPCDGPSEVTDLIIKPNKFSLLVKWSNPKPDCEYKYIVTWKISDEIINSTLTDKTDYQVDNLNACETYTVSVQISYKEISTFTNPVSENSETLDAILPVIDLKPQYYEKEKILLVTWDVPNSVKKCHTANIIRSLIEDTSLALEISDNQFKFLEVNSCDNYKIFVQAKSKGNEISSEESINFTKPNVNDPPIFIYDETDVQDDYVITNWSFGKNICRPEEFKVTCTSDEKDVLTQYGEIDIINKKLIANITNIEPYTKYTCTGTIENSAGTSENSEPATFTTKSKPPGLPRNIKIVLEKNTLRVTWSPPEKWNGKPEKFKIEVNYIGLNYNLVEGCKEENPDTCSSNLSWDETEFLCENIIPAAKYKISISAQSSGGLGNETIADIISMEEIPEKPTNLATEILDPKTINYNVSVQVTWETPCKMNGKLKQYFVQLLKGGDELSDSASIGPNDNKYYSYLFANLTPETSYVVKVWAKNGLAYDGNSSKMMIDTPAGIPTNVIEENLIEPNPITEEPWKSAVVYITNNIFDETNGKIQYYSIIVGTQDCLEYPTHGSYIYNEINTWPTIVPDNSLCSKESRAYEASPKQWNPLKNINNDVYKFLLGEIENCTEIDCNKPLTPSTKYYIKIRGFTKHGYIDTKLLSLETAAYGDVPVGLIVGLIVGILVIAIIIAAVLFYTKGKLNFKNWPRGNSVNQISPAPLPVPLKKFGSHYENMMENPGKIKNEFQLLSTISSDVTLSTKTALLPMNKKKNRYINILPYDQTRVKLEVNNTNSTDYINASFVKGYNGYNEYIATQGPTEQTCPAFWQMVLEQNVKLIVMLTQFVELGKEKCYKYFPDLKEEYELLNDINIICTEDKLLDTYYRRVFQIKNGFGGSTKKVIHIQFIHWPDFGVPNELHHMVDFCEIMKDIRKKERGMTIMHCSAGVGRTGTLIAVDILLQSIKDKRKVDIFGTVLNLRKQRMNMVQSEKQYEFLYRMTYYIITNNTIIPSKDSLLSISESDML